MLHVPTPRETNGFLDYSVEAFLDNEQLEEWHQLAFMCDWGAQARTYRLDYYRMYEIHFQNRLCMRFHLDCIRFYPEMTLRLVTLARCRRSHIPANKIHFEVIICVRGCLLTDVGHKNSLILACVK